MSLQDKQIVPWDLSCSLTSTLVHADIDPVDILGELSIAYQ